jgi:uncharacterized protein YcbK (DUF882 family)
MRLRLPTLAAASLSLGLGLSAAALHAAPEPGIRAAPTHATVSAADTVGLMAAGAAASSTRADAPLAEIVRIDRRALGHSGSLRVAVAHVLEVLDLPFIRQEDLADGVTYRWVPLFGTEPEPVAGEVRLASGLRAPSQPGFWRLRVSRDEEQHEVEELTVVTKVPFHQKRNGRLNGYLIGTYPMEGSGRTDRYAPPVGFIEVTPQNRDMFISRHLRLGQFLTKDQFDVWPKYVALDLQLIDKLELVMQELHAMGVRAERMHIMSGYRTPNYNGPGEGGRALLSRHTYGDAADIWIENGARTGYIADLNGDGRQDIRDADVIVQAVERVEQKFPELAGGVGLYRDSGARGPFVHVDVRGVRSRW